jgi:hypothetical protein
MTDARFPERWLNDRRVLRLPDAAFRLFVCALAWSVANRTDGYLSDEDLALIPGVDLTAAKALYDAELWWGHMHGAQITEFEDTQTSAAQLEATAIARRASDRKRQARHRKALASRDGHVTNPRDNTRTGQARPGTETEGQVRWLPTGEELDAVASDSASPSGSEAERGSAGTTPSPDGVQPPTPSQTRKRVHDGPEAPRVADVQKFPIDAAVQSQATDRNPRASGSWFKPPGSEAAS